MEQLTRDFSNRISMSTFFFKGGISVSEVLDYEFCKKFYLVVEAKDGGTPALSAVATVSINVTDVNDNSPQFSQDVYSAVISEDASVGDSVILVGASGKVQMSENNNPQ